jgi:uncharacterized membrane protein
VMSSIREWLHLAVRWFHVFAGIMWVGQTYYFTWLDGQFNKLEQKAVAGRNAPALWMVHSGGFYTVEKQRSLQVGPELVHWFRWEAMMTWLSGILLLFLLYYFGGGLIDTDVADISLVRGISVGLGVIVFDIFTAHDCCHLVGIGACIQRSRRLHPRRGDVRNDHGA